MGDVISLMLDPPTGQYRSYHKTCRCRLFSASIAAEAQARGAGIDGPSGEQFWKRAVGVSVSDDFAKWNLTRRLLAHPDALDGADPGDPGREVGTELHGGLAHLVRSDRFRNARLFVVHNLKD